MKVRKAIAEGYKTSKPVVKPPTPTPQGNKNKLKRPNAAIYEDD